VAAALNRFAFDVYAKAHPVDSNWVFSPASLAHTLTFTAYGTRGVTFAEMARVLHADTINDIPIFACLIEAGYLFEIFKRTDGAASVVLQVADRLWRQTGTALKMTFRPYHYLASLGEVDLFGAPGAARNEINGWTSDQTDGRLPEVVGAGALSRRMKFVVTTAAALTCRWERRFDPADTLDAEFVTPSGKAVVKQMTAQGVFAYARVDDVQLIEVPIRMGLSLVVVMPDAADGLSKLETRMAKAYERWLLSMSPTLVNLRLPRWTAASALELHTVLSMLGMPLALGIQANFLGMTPSTNVHLDRVFHGAFVDVGKHGSEQEDAAVLSVDFADAWRRAADAGVSSGAEGGAGEIFSSRADLPLTPSRA
jgi:serine protease inhibitor